MGRGLGRVRSGLRDFFVCVSALEITLVIVCVLNMLFYVLFFFVFDFGCVHFFFLFVLRHFFGGLRYFVICFVRFRYLRFILAAVFD